MTAYSEQFGAYFREHLNEHIDRLVQQIEPILSNGQLQDGLISNEQRAQRLIVSFEHMADAMASGKKETMIAFANNLGQQRATERWSVSHMMAIFDIMRSYIWDYLLQYIKDHPEYKPEDINAIEDVLHTYQGAYFGSFRGYYEQMQRDMLSQQEELERQHRLVQELGTPIVPVYEGILLIPLVGQINEFRAMRVTEQVLEAIVQQQADVLLIDITGVPIIDTSIANHLMTLTRAVRLLGTDVIMVGLGAEIAQTIVHLGINLNGIATLANLQDGLVEALRRRGLSIRNGENVALEMVH